MATFSKAKDALAALAERTQRTTERQRSIARKLKVTLPEKLPCLVAAARIKRAMSRELFEALHPPSESQLEYLESLCPPNTRLKQAIASRDSTEVAAWIEHEELLRRFNALRGLGLSEGDVVRVTTGAEERMAEVHSFGANGRVYFKGGLGFSSWPDRISVIHRQGDKSSRAAEARRNIANDVSRHTTARTWSQAREQELAEYKIHMTFSESDLDGLIRIVENAPNESSIQRYLESCPQLLAGLLTGRSRYVVPRPSLAGKYVPDFLLADVDSSGIRWVLLELETTGSGITLTTESSFDKYVRKGVSQVQDWRRWLTKNLAHARECKADGGAGLTDIDPDSSAIVIAGRRHLLKPLARDIRRPFEQKNQISVHTYDWLIERLQGTLKYDGLPALNPDALPR